MFEVLIADYHKHIAFLLLTTRDTSLCINVDLTLVQRLTTYKGRPMLFQGKATSPKTS